MQPCATPREGTPVDRGRWPVIYLSPRGKPFDQATARRLAAVTGITLLCGRFEGVDQRVLDHHQVEEISLGDFVLTGGEIAAQALIDATVRLIPGVLGNQSPPKRKAFRTGFWNTRSTPARPSGRAGRSRSPAIGQPCRDRQLAAGEAEALTSAPPRLVGQAPQLGLRKA